MSADRPVRRGSLGAPGTLGCLRVSPVRFVTALDGAQVVMLADYWLEAARDPGLVSGWCPAAAAGEQVVRFEAGEREPQVCGCAGVHAGAEAVAGGDEAYERGGVEVAEPFDLGQGGADLGVGVCRAGHDAVH